MPIPAVSKDDAPHILVACLCAQWCSSCRDYRVAFEQAERELAGVRFVWIDVEDDSDLVGSLDIETFPTLLIASADGPRFFGPLAPQREVLVRLVRAHLVDPGGGTLPDPDLRALVTQLQAFHTR